MKKKYLTFIILLIIFISLGIPDGVLGSAWPVISDEIGVSLVYLAVLSNLNFFVSFLSSLSYPKIRKKFNLNTIIIFSISVTIMSLLGFSISNSLFSLVIFSMFLGLGGGLIDTSVNDFSTKRFNVAAINVLHGSWGIGISLGSFVIATTFRFNGDWHLAYVIVALIQLSILIVVFFNKKYLIDEEMDEENTEEVVSVLPKITILSIGFYFFYGIEYVIGLYVSSYAAEFLNLSEDKSAFATTLFWFGLTIGRFVTLVTHKKLTNYQIIISSLFFVLIGSIAIVISSNLLLFIGLVGFGLGPLYPTMMSSVTQIYQKQNVTKVVSLQVSSALFGVLILPFVYSFLFRYISYGLMFYLAIISVIILFVCTYLLFKNKEKN